MLLLSMFNFASVSENETQKLNEVTQLFLKMKVL